MAEGRIDVAESQAYSHSKRLGLRYVLKVELSTFLFHFFMKRTLDVGTREFI